MARHSRGIFLLPLLILCVPCLVGQDASTGAIRGTVADSFGHPIVDASVALVDSAQGFHYFVTSDSEGKFVFEFLPPGEYAARAVAPDMSPELTPKLEVHAGATIQLDFKLQVGGAKEMVTVSGEPPMVETESHSVSSLVDKRAIEELPLDGRRFTDLALLTPGVTQDPRGLTSGSNGVNLPAFLWTAYAQSGFSDSNRRTQRDHKLRFYDQASAAFGRCKLK